MKHLKEIVAPLDTMPRASRREKRSSSLPAWPKCSLLCQTSDGDITAGPPADLFQNAGKGILRPNTKRHCSPLEEAEPRRSGWQWLPCSHHARLSYAVLRASGIGRPRFRGLVMNLFRKSAF